MRLTKTQREVVDKLFTGHYLMVRDADRYTLYTGKQNPKRIYPYRTVKSILQICKQDKHGKYTLNLKTIRQMPKWDYVKQVYEAFRLITEEERNELIQTSN